MNRALRAAMLALAAGAAGLVSAGAISPAPARATPQLSWSAPLPADGVGTPSAIACPSHALCVAVDRSGHVLTSNAPSVSSPSWTAATIDSLHALTSVSCPSPQLCVAVDEAGRVLVSTDPSSAQASAWSLPQPIDGSLSGPSALTAVWCASESLCLAVDRAGGVHSSTHPASSDQAWTRVAIDSGHALESVSCASAQLCVAADDAGAVLTSGEPAGAAAAWQRRAIDPTPPLSSIACAPAGGSCVAVDRSGSALASADPLSASSTWSSTVIDPVGALNGVSCGAYGVCVAVDEAGHALAGEAPWGALPAWSSTTPDADPLVGVSCAQDGFCAAIDNAGRFIWATVPAPPSEPPPPPPKASLVTPHPSIAGVPAVGSRLICEPGIAPGEPATLAYAWSRDGAAIAGAGNSSYRVGSADATHHLQCLITATNEAGSVTGHSAFVTIPAQGVLAAVNETGVGRARVSAGRVYVPVRCSVRAPAGCAIALRLSVVRVVHGRRVALTVGESNVRLKRAQRRTLPVSLDALGRQLLAHAKRLSVQLSVSGTVIGVLKATLSRQRLTFASSGRGHAARLAWEDPRAEAAQVPPPGARPPLAGRADAGGAAPGHTQAPPYTPTVLTPTPYMGWDVYFAFGPRYSESNVLAQASALLFGGLAHRGYRYVWLDAGWWQGQRDSHGQIVVNRSQWPHGMGWLASTLHSAGLRAGLYTDVGRDGCGGRRQGSYGHYRQDANTFAAWGFDAVKVDFCGGVRMHLDPASAYSAFHAALESNASHRPLLLSICNFLEPGQFHGEPPFEQSAFTSYTFGPSTGNSWRTDTDVGSPGHVTFPTVLRNLDADAAHPEVAGPGHWNDPDYLGPDQGLSEEQFRTQLSMWAMLAAPLMVSADLERIAPPSLAALANTEVLAIDQDPAGAQGGLISSSGAGQVWAKPLSDGSRAVALLNRGSVPLWIEASASGVGLPAAGSYTVRDVWKHTRHRSGGALAAEVPGESTVLLRVSAQRAGASARSRAR